MFTKEEIQEIRNTRLSDVITNSTTIQPDQLQGNVFLWETGNPCPQPQQLNASFLEPCDFIQGFDYFEVNNIFTSLAYYKLKTKGCLYKNFLGFAGK